MEKVSRKFKSIADADAADAEFYRSLTPEQRMGIFSELQRRHQGDPPPRLDKMVCRVIQLRDHDD